MNLFYAFLRPLLLKQTSAWAVCLLLGLLTSFTTSAQVTISLQMAEKNNLTTVPAGERITLKLDYSISSTTGNATGVKAVLNLPDDVFSIVDLVGTVHAPVANFVFDQTPGAKKLTINFVEPVPSGSTGVLEVGVKFKNGTIPNNTIETFTSVLTDGSGNTSGVKTLTTNITAVPSLCVNKTLVGGGAIDGFTTYQIVTKTTNNGDGLVFGGYLQAENIVITDNLPAGAVFVEANLYDRFGNVIASLTPVGNVLSFTIPTLGVFASGIYWAGDNYKAFIKVRFPSPTFSAGDPVTNRIGVTYNILGGATQTLTDGQTIGACSSALTITTTLQAANPTATIAKQTDGGKTQYLPGEVIRYGVQYANTGNVDLENYELIDDVPANLNLGYVYGNRNLTYQSNLHPTYVPVILDGYDNVVLAPGEIVTKLRVTPTPTGGPLLPGASIALTLGFTQLGEVTTSTSFTNCVQWNSTTPGISANRTACAVATQEPRLTTAGGSLLATLSVCGGLFTIGDQIGVQITYGALTSGADIQNPVVMSLLPPGHTLVPGSVVFNPKSTSLTAPTTEILPNYNGTGRTLLRFRFPTGTVLKASAGTFGIDYTFKIGLGSQAGGGVAPDNYGYGDNLANGVYTDIYDLNGNGSTTDKFNTYEKWCAGYTVASSASMESVKWVKGQCDTKYSRFPDVGTTLPGGSADYRLVVKNTGTVPMTQVKIIDILPFVGDRGVIDPSARNTIWRPNLAAPLTPPSGVTVYYSTIQNPCRDEVKSASDPSPFPTGCTPPNWSTAPPSDITQVQSLKLDFGTQVIQPNDSLITTWPMRAPVSAPTNGEIAWNSFAFLATRTDNNQNLLAAEPIKVGIKVKAPTPGIWGDFVWMDTNKDGIQDSGELGVPGVTVTLYSASGSTPNPATDSQIGFTVTGSDGRYLFTNLPVGNYYAVFNVPPGYTTSPNTRPTNNANGSEGPITGIYPIASAQDDRTHDLGIYLSTDCGIKITNATVSPCLYDPVAKISRTTINVFVQWANAPAGQNITVTLDGGNAQTINVTGGATSPALVSFTALSDGNSHILDAGFNGTCKDTKTVDAPLPCAPGICAVEITDVRFGACDKVGTNRTATVKLAWTNVPSGEDINVYYNGLLIGTVLTSGGITSPTDLLVTLPATGVSYPLVAQLTSTSSCSTTTPVTVPVCAALCSLTATATPTACVPATNQYSVSGTISLTSAVAGTATITDGTKSTTVAVAANDTSVPYSLTGLTSDEAIHTITVSLANCGTVSLTYTAPPSCSVAALCSLTATATPTICNTATNTYSVAGDILLTNNLLGGTASVSDGATTKLITIPASATSVPYSLTGLTSDAASHTVTVSLTGCGSAVATYTAPASCSVAPPAIAVVVDTPICNTATNNYTTTGTVSLSNAPAATLTLRDNGTVVGTVSVTAGQTSATFTLTGVSGSSPASHTVVATLANGVTVVANTTYATPASCTVCSLSLATSLLSNGQIGTAYSETLTTSGGTAPVSYTISAGTLPAGLTLNPTTGVISGTPTAPAGTASFTVKVTDAKNCSAIAPLTITTSTEPVCELTATATPGVCNSVTNQYTVTGTISATNAGTNSPQTLTVSVNGTSTVVTLTGNGPVSYTLAGLNSDGTVQTVTVMSSATACGMTSVTYAAPASCSIAPPSLTVVVSTPVCNTATNIYTATGTVSLTNVPTGATLTITDNGAVVSTTALTAGQTSATFSVTGISDASSHTVVATLTGGTSASTTYSAPVSCTVCSLSLTTIVLSAGQVGTAYSQTLTTSGGTAPLVFATINGSLPIGLTLNTATGEISGTPTSATTTSFTISVTDAKSCSAVAPLTITTSNLPVCSLTATATPTTCNTATNQYSVSGTISATNTPANQSLTISVGSVTTTVTLSGNGPVSYTLAGLNSDGTVQTVTVMSSATACGMTSVTYTAPASCTVALKASLGDYVWLDSNKDGVQDGTESGVSSVTVVLCDATSGTAISTTVTDGAGKYLFANLDPGSYVVKFTAPAGTTFTVPTSSSATPATDSNVTSFTGQKGSTAPVSLTAGENNLTIDAGLIPVIAPPSLTVVVAAPVCNSATNQYTATGTVSLTNVPTGATLTITDNGTTISSQSLTVGQTSATFSVSGISNAASHTVVATLTNSVTVSSSTSYLAPVSCTVCSLSLTTAMLPNAQVGTAYSQTIQTTGGTAPLVFATINGSLPIGLTLNTATGEISGTPTSATTTSFTISVTDAKSCSAVAPLTISTSNLPVCSLTATATPTTCNTATNQYAVTGTVSATNTTGNSSLTVSVGSVNTVVALTGNGPASYTLAGLNSDGTVQTVTVMSSATACGMASVTYTAPASCTVAPPALAVLVSNPVCNSLTNNYTATATVSLSNATAGTLTITDNGTTISTASVTAGQASASFSVTGISDAVSHTVIASLNTTTATTTYTAPVACTVCSLSLVTTRLANGQVNTPYSQVLVTTGGTAPLTFSVVAGSLPDGLSLNPVTGVISGTPTSATTANVTITIVDGKKCALSRVSYTLSVNTEPVCSLTATATPGTCNTATSQYAVTGTVSATNTPANQSLTISVGLVNTVVTLTGDGPISYTLAGLDSDGLTKTVTVISSATACGMTSVTYTAPQACTVAPTLSVDISTPVCNSATGKFTATATVSFSNVPAGTLTVTDNGVTIGTATITAGQATATFSLTGVSGSLPANRTVIASLQASPAISGSTTYAVPADCFVCPKPVCLPITIQRVKR